MRKIATGYYNAVYDLNNGYVLKKKNSLWDRFKKIYSEEHSVWNTLKVMMRMPKEHLSLLEQEIQQGIFTGDLDILANPVFRDGGYMQDRVVVIKDYFAAHGLEENKMIIDKYVESIYLCWKNHIHEKIFNFTVNNGVDKQGNVVLIDINETSRNKEDARNSIMSKRWLKSMSYVTLDPVLKKYYAEAMDQGLTVEKLNMFWVE